ncbi:MAG TPA: hypothetical protein VMV49_10085 [Candidatus Deferrimicrobium sp.]|nr:hypothetical protein [Candidatus Deferrimicrobium sp.]
MKKKGLIISIILIGVICSVGFLLKFLFFRFPNTVPPGEDPAILLPLYDFSHNNYIQGFGQITPEYYHNGIDFGVNDTTTIVAPHDAYVMEVKFWFNDKGGHWQTNVNLWLNSQWRLEIIFESWAENESFGIIQKNAIGVTQNQFIEVNETIGNLLHHGEATHIHFSVYSNNVGVCPYNYFTSSAKITFETQFYLVNYTPYWCI